METRINVAELLRNCPRGMELNCVMFENLYFDCIDDSLEDYPFPIYCYYVNDNEARSSVRFTKYGTYLNLSNDKCVIFPKGKDSWEGFVPPVEFKNGGKIHPWTIQDAKDGDVLAINWCKDGDSWEKIIIFKKYHNEGVEGYGNTFKNGELVFHEEVPYFSKTWTKNLHPATKEQCNLLFQKIKEAGYKWNAEKKCLEKLPKFKDGDIVTCGWNSDSNSFSWTCIVAEPPCKITDNYLINYYCSLDCNGDFVSYNSAADSATWVRLATEEEKERLFRAIKDNGYKWNTEVKILEKLIEPKFKVGDRIKRDKDCTSGTIVKISDDGFYVYKQKEGSVVCINLACQDDWELVPDKFDITTLKPFDKVLVRDIDSEEWGIDFFEKFDATRSYPFYCMKNEYRQCVPYAGNEHLFDTDDECSNYYKIW